MEFLNFTLAALISVGAGLVGQQLYDASPRLALWWISHATRRLSSEKRDRYAEEWAAHSQECLGKLGKLNHAFGCAVASYRIEPPEFMVRGRRLVMLYACEKFVFWGLTRRAQLLEEITRKMNRDGLGEDENLRIELDKYLDMTVQFHLIKIVRERIWRDLRGK